MATPPPTPTTSIPATTNFFKPLDFCDLIFHQPFFIFRRHPICFLTIALFASGLRAFLAFVFDWANGPNYGADYGTNAEVTGAYNLDANVNQELDAAAIFMSFTDSLILFVVACLADGAVVKVVADIYAGQAITSPSPVAYFGTVAFKAVPLVGSCLVVTFAMSLPLLILMPIMFSGRPGGLFLIVVVYSIIAVYISIITFVMYPAIVVEHKGILDSIQRSYSLTQGHLMKIFATVFLYNLFKSLLGVLVVSATMSYELNGNMALFYTRAVLSFCINTLFIALFSILKAVTYFNIRITDEQLTQEKLVEEMGELDAYVQMDEKKDTVEMETQAATTTEQPVAAVEKEVV